MIDILKNITKVFNNSTRVELSGNRPYSIGEPALYLVEKGGVDVFFIRKEGDLLAVSSFAEKDVFSLPAGMRVSGREGSIIKVLKLSDLLIASLDDDELNSVVCSITHFVDGFINKNESLPLQGCVYEYAELELQEGEVLRGGAVPALVEVVGDIEYGGQSVNGIINTLMLSDSSWVRATNSVRVIPIAINNDKLTAAISEWHNILLGILSDIENELDNDWVERVGQQSKGNVENFSNTLSHLSKVMESGRTLGVMNDELTTVCYEAASVKGIEVNTNKVKLSKSIEDFSMQLGLRCRKIRLENDWHKSDAGVFVGWISGKPAVLKPNGDSYNYAYAGGSYSKVTADIANEFESFGWSIFDSLPDDKVKERDVFKMIWKEGSGDLIWVLLLGIVTGLLGMATPSATGMIVGQIIPGGKYGMLFEFGLGLFVATVASSLFALVQGFATMRFATRSSFKLQSAVWDRLLSLPAAFFSKYDAGDLSSRALGIIAVKDIISNNLLSTVLGVAVGGFNIIVASLYSWKLTLVVIGFALVGSMAGFVLSMYQLRFQRKVQKIGGEIEGLVLQLITGISKLRVAGAEVRAFSRWSRLFAKQRKYSFDYSIFSNIFSMMFSLMPLLQTALIFYIIVSTSDDKRISTGAYMAFTAAAAQIGSAVNSISGTAIAIIQALPQYERAKPILKELPERQRNAMEATELNGNVEIRGVNFSYDDKNTILHDFNFKASKGEFVALVGASGAGKSTALRILLGLEKPSSGMILFDDVDMSTYNVSSLRKQFGVVLQGGGIMQGSIFSNVCGAQSLSQEQVWGALDQAGLSEEVSAMPMGIHTVLPQGGGVLSGGQQQRLMIARALASNPKILFFDEATSALDNTLQAEVSANLEKMNLTRIVVAHRLSTIQNADRIYVMDGGRVAQVGTFEELVKDSEGIFALLCRRQVL